jgi:hypothetical protein
LTIILVETVRALLASSIGSARQEAQSWATPLVITEFGIGANNVVAGDWLGHFLDSADLALASWTLWLWKEQLEQSQSNWGLYTLNTEGSRSPRSATFDVVSRPYAQRLLHLADEAVHRRPAPSLKTGLRQRELVGARVHAFLEVTETVSDPPRLLRLEVGLDLVRFAPHLAASH